MVSLKHTLVLTLAGLLCVAAIALEGSTGYLFFLDELYPAPPPESPSSDAVATVHPALAERLVLIVVDAGREDLFTNAEIMPELEALSHAPNARRGVAITQPITMTLLSVLNLGTGRTPGVAWSVQNFEAEPFPDESLFYWAAAADMGVAFAGDAAWSQLFGAFASLDETYDDSGFYARFDGALTLKDHKTLATAKRVLAQPEQFPLVVAHFTSTDKVSHRDGATLRDSTGALSTYAQTGTATDAVIGELHRRHARPSDLWLITSDHGATDQGYHGGGETQARRAPFLLVGAGVAPGPPVEIALNAWAPTLSVALGLPVPRTAEIPAAFEMLALGPDARAALMRAHAERRLGFVEGVVDVLEASPGEMNGLGAVLERDPEAAISNSQIVLGELRSHRRWFYLLGGALGVGLLIAGFVLLMSRTAPEPQPRALTAIAAVVWLGLVSLLLVWDGWLFYLFDHLSQAFEGPWEAMRALLWLLGLSGLGLLLPRVLSGRSEGMSAAWICGVFGLAVIATSQVAIQWPYGALAEGFRALLVWGTILAAVHVLRSDDGRPWLWAVGAVSVGGLVWLHSALDSGHMQTLDETSQSFTLALGAVIAGGVWAGIRLFRREPLWGLRGAGVAVLLGVVSCAWAYRVDAMPDTARLALAGLALVLLVLLAGVFCRQTRRDVMGVWALGLAHVMANDWVCLATFALAGLAWVLGELRWPERRWVPLAVAALIGVLDVAFFFTLGYRYSFTSMDVHVVFMLDRDQINLAQGFLLLALQHAASWFLLWTAVIGNRLEAGDRRGLETLFAGVMMIFVIRTWGPFFALSFRADNFWFSSHAVPMFVMCLVAAAVATLTFGVVLGVLRRETPMRLPRSTKAALATGAE